MSESYTCNCIAPHYEKVCLFCISRIAKKYQKLLEFVKEIAEDQSRIFVDLDDIAKKLLEEIGE